MHFWKLLATIVVKYQLLKRTADSDVKPESGPSIVADNISNHNVSEKAEASDANTAVNRNHLGEMITLVNCNLTDKTAHCNMDLNTTDGVLNNDTNHTYNMEKSTNDTGSDISMLVNLLQPASKQNATKTAPQGQADDILTWDLQVNSSWREKLSGKQHIHYSTQLLIK